MDDYRKMYFTLFNKITDVIGELEEAQQLAEEMYISEDPVHFSTSAISADGSKSKSE